MTKRNDTGAILTVPDEITVEEKLYLTGNEYISLPEIDPAGGIRSLNVLRLDHKGLLEFCGNEDKPLISPNLEVDGNIISLADRADWQYRLDWMPEFSLSDQSEISFEGSIVAPPGCKGFYYKLSLTNNGEGKIAAKLGWKGGWSGFNYIVFNRRPVEGTRRISYSSWTESLVLEAAAGLPLAAAALSIEPEAPWRYEQESGTFSALHEISLEPKQLFETFLYVAVNLEADGAATTCVGLRRQGAQNLGKAAYDWLSDRRVELEESDLKGPLNKNLFFNYFYSTARSLDSEELVPVTSRSPRYYVSAAFWSRDALLWSFPAIMIVSNDTARELLLAVFQKHIRNAGDHAHYINGSLLYPGFELDQLAAHFLALELYSSQNSDSPLLKDNIILEGLNSLIEKALDRFDPDSGLYSTFLDPSDDPAHYPYLTYANVLLQRSFNYLARLQSAELWFHKIDFAVLASELQQSIYEHCMVKGPFGTMFAWAVDGTGKFFLYDNPPGSLQLLAHYNFCSINDTVYQNTVHWIRSSNNRYYHHGTNFEETGSQHAGNPWPLGACNDLLACNAGGSDFFRRAEMDNGFFCETVSDDTGRVTTGAAFASGAGFMAYALTQGLKGKRCENSGQEGEQGALEGDK